MLQPRQHLREQRNQSLSAILTGEALSDVHWWGNGNSEGNCAEIKEIKPIPEM